MDTGASKTIVSQELFKKIKTGPFPISRPVIMNLAGKDQKMQAREFGPVKIDFLGGAESI